MRPQVEAGGAALRTIVVDEEPRAGEELAFLLGQCDRVQVVGQARFASEAEALCEEIKPQLAFIDLRMPGLDGIALANALRAKHLDLEVVIVSAHDDDALRGFDAQVADYLLKPVSLSRLQRAIHRVCQARPELMERKRALRRFAVRRKSGYVVVGVDDVIYFEARDDFVWAVTSSDRFAMNRTLAALAEELDEQTFFQSHRSCIVRVDRIRKIEPAGVRTFRIVVDHPEGARVPLARDRVAALRERIPFLR